MLIKKRMAIKNWTVTVESTKSVTAREIYLHDAHHANHKNTEKIIDVHGSKDTMISINRNCESYNLTNALKRKGGRPATPALEFVFTLPKGDQFRPSLEQWRKMIGPVIGAMYRSAGYKGDGKALNNMVRAVVHQQDNNAIKGTGDHIHVVCGKFTPDGQYLRDLQKKGVLNVAKQRFNKAVYDTLGIDHKTYVAEKKYQGVAKKRAPQWKVKAARINDLLKKKKEQTLADARRNEDERQRLDELKSDLFVKEVQINAISEENERTERFLRTFIENYEKVYEYHKNQRFSRVNSTANRLEKAVSSNQHIQMSQENADLVNNMINDVNQQFNQSIPTFRPKMR